MTREEAIKICVREKEQIQQALDVCADGDNYVSPDGMITALDYVEAMGMAIAALREQPRWISVEEKLPEEATRVLVHLDGNKPPIGEPRMDTDRVVDGRWVRWDDLVTHWMPMPEAPEVDG